MTDHEPQGCRCGKPTRDAAYTCDDCGDQLARALGDVPWLDEELDTTASKQAGVDYRRVGGGSGGKKPSERPSPVSWGASEAKTRLHGLLVSWVLYCDTEQVRNSSPYYGLPPDNLPAMSRWLMWRVDGLLLHEIAPEAVDEITNAIAECHRLIDRAPDQEFYGPCECGRDLYAKPGAKAIACRSCGKGYDADEMAEWMFGQVAGKLVTLREGRVLLGKMGLPVAHDTLKTWAKRDKVLAHGTNLEGVTIYRFDDLWRYAASRAA